MVIVPCPTFSKTHFDRFPGLHLENGIFYWFHIFYGCFLILVGTILVLNFLAHGWQYFQRQGVILIVGILIPWIGIFLDIFDLNPFEPIYLTPITFTLAGLLITWGILRYQLLDIIPIAREAVIEQMTDGVVVLDTQDRIVDLNKAAQTIFNISLAEAIGKKISEYWPAWAELVSTNLTRSGMEREARISYDGLAHQYEVRITPLTDLQLNTNGKLVILQDITRTRKDEKALQRRDAILQAISYAGELFLSGKNWEESIQLVLARLGEATDVCRVSIFRNQVDERRTLRSSLCYEWTGVGITSRIDIPEIENVSLQLQGHGDTAAQRAREGGQKIATHGRIRVLHHVCSLLYG